MNLFIVEDGVVKPKPETLLIEPFKSLWEKDETKKKSEAIKHLTFINFMCSFFTSNPFKDIINSKEREEAIIRSSFDGDYKPTNEIYEIIEWCKKVFLKEMSLSYNTLVSAKESSDKLNQFLRDVDLDERNEKGYPIYKPTDITRATKDLAAQMDAIKKLEVTAMEEYKESSRTKQNAVINPLER